MMGKLDNGAAGAFRRSAAPAVVISAMLAPALTCLLLLLLVPATVRGDAASGAYQSPNFDAPLFERDATSLEGDDLDLVMAALVAVVRNFSGVPTIDTDVKEKAIAVALCLSPLDAEARAAHEQLLAGEASTSSAASAVVFSSGKEVFEALGTQAEKLWRESRQPDDAVLATILMELALTVLTPLDWQSEGARHLAKIYSSLLEESDNASRWDKVVTLQPIAGDGASALASRLRALSTAAPVAPTPPSMATGSDGAARPSMGEMRPSQPATGGSSSKGLEVKRDSGEIFFLATGPNGRMSFPGRVSLRVRPLDETETSLFGLFGGEAAGQGDGKPDMRLRAGNSGPRAYQLRRFDTAEEWAREHYNGWPELKIGRVELSLLKEPDGDFKPPKRDFGPGRARFGIFGVDPDDSARLGPCDVSLPLALLLDSAFSGRELDPGLVVGGSLERRGQLESLQAAAVTLRGMEDVPVEERAKLSLLVLPEAALDDESLHDRAVMREVELFLQPQVIAVSSIEALRDIAVEADRPAALSEAMAQFAEVAQLANLAGQLQNQFVRDRLQGVLDKWPGHVSARWLLAAGSGESAQLTLEGSIEEIDAALAPLVERYDPTENAEGEIAGVDALVNQVKDQLKALEPLLHESARDYKLGAENLVGPLRDYFSLKNRTAGNSNAQQHRRAVNDRLRTLALLQPKFAG